MSSPENRRDPSIGDQHCSCKNAATRQSRLTRSKGPDRRSNGEAPTRYSKANLQLDLGRLVDLRRLAILRQYRRRVGRKSAHRSAAAPEVITGLDTDESAVGASRHAKKSDAELYHPCIYPICASLTALAGHDSAEIQKCRLQLDYRVNRTTMAA
jgi:hypothetical protein